jgi:hypothetical protein
MFERPSLEDRSFNIDDWTVTFPVDAAKVPIKTTVSSAPRPMRRAKTLISLLKN